MELEFWGVRGTFPLARKPASAFGGNTPCAAVTSRLGDILIVDAGTGIHALGNKLAAGPQGTGRRASVRPAAPVRSRPVDHVRLGRERLVGAEDVALAVLEPGGPVDVA